METNKKYRSDYQVNLLGKYFTDFELQISKAKSREEAETLGRNKLLSFSTECESEIIKNGVKNYIADLITKYH